MPGLLPREPELRQELREQQEPLLRAQLLAVLQEQQEQVLLQAPPLLQGPDLILLELLLQGFLEWIAAPVRVPAHAQKVKIQLLFPYGQTPRRLQRVCVLSRRGVLA